MVHRIDLHKQLKEAATSHAKIGTPVALHTGCKIVDIDCTTATVTLESGEKFSGDILLGADGVHVCIPYAESLGLMLIVHSLSSEVPWLVICHSPNV